MEITQALLITAIGMGLVFLGILILWGMMALLVFIFRDRLPKLVDVKQDASLPIKMKAAVAAVAVAKANAELRSQAAAAAVATLLAAGSTAAMAIERPGTGASSWQIVHRMNQINLRNNAFTRKPRGNQS